MFLVYLIFIQLLTLLRNIQNIGTSEFTLSFQASTRKVTGKHKITVIKTTL